MKNTLKKISEHSFTLKSFGRGVFFSITKYIKSSIFRLLTVNHEQTSMPVKYNANLINKLHPNTIIVHWPI